jgi:hypothetical protein
MLGIMKKDWLFYLGYLLMLPMQLLYWHTTRKHLDTTVVFMVTGWLYIVILGSMLGVEMNEMKNRGYLFLAALPVRAREIVGGKLIPILVLTVTYVLVTYFTLSGLEAQPEHLALSRKWLILNGALALGMAGVIYWIIFRFGFEKAVYLQAILFALAFVAPIALNELVIRGHINEASEIVRLAESVSNGVIILAGIVIFIATCCLSARTLERESPA